METLDRFFKKVFAFDPEFRREGDLSAAETFVFRVVGEIEKFRMLRRQICQHEFQRIHHAHAARCGRIQFVAHAVFQHAVADHGILLGDTGTFPERADRGRGESTPPRPTERGHARIVPAVYQSILDQGHELALAHHGEIEIAARELDLSRSTRRITESGRGQRFGELRMRRQIDFVHAPVVERPMVLEFERAQ